MVKREVPWSEKRKFALWATEETLEKTKTWYKKDNCFSRSEFIEKAIDFYVGYLSSVSYTHLRNDHLSKMGKYEICVPKPRILVQGILC